MFGLGELCWVASPARGSPGFDLGARCASQQVNAHQTLQPSLDSSTCSVHINTGSHTTHSVHVPTRAASLTTNAKQSSSAAFQNKQTKPLQWTQLQCGDNQPVLVLLLLRSQSGLQELKVSFPSPSKHPQQNIPMLQLCPFPRAL